MNINLEQINEVKDILGDQTERLITRYIEDTRTTLSEIDIARSTQNEVDVINYVHTLKSSSFQVGATKVMGQATLIEKFLTDNSHKLNALHNQARLDHMIDVLRTYYAAYQDEIFKHL